MNRHLELPGGSEAKLEYAALSFEVTKEHLSDPLYVFFRALNFTDAGDGHKAAEGCLALYMEAEFRPHPSDCKHNAALESSSVIQTLTDDTQTSVLAAASKGKGAIGAAHSITDPSNTFFAYQDFYLPEASDRAVSESDREVTVSLQQKFIESNTLDFVVEVLEYDVDFHAIDKDAHSPRWNSGTDSQSHSGLGTRHHDTAGREQRLQGSLGPKCKGICLVGGEKAYNEMLRTLELGARTYFRVWVFQQTPTSRAAESNWCANFELLVSTRQSGAGAR